MNTSDLAATGLASVLAVASASAQVSPDFDPRGIYHNVFSGGFSGTEWFQVTPISGTNRYAVADIFGGGFNATISPAGAVTLDGGIGSGSFSSDDAWIINPNLGGTPFTFNNLRAPETTPDFPLTLDSPATVNPLLAGTWRSLTEQLNPRTGAVIGGGFENLTITVSGTTFRITDPGGLFFQGVAESPNDIGFRFVTPTPSDTRFRTFPGSSINFTQNMLGRATIEDINTWSAIILLQSRAPLGSQTQLAFRFSATRVDPLPFGDINGDRQVNNADLQLIAILLGLTELDGGFNIAADLDADGDIDADDQAILAALLNPACNDADLAEPFGALDIADVVEFLRAFGAGDEAADLAAPLGAFDIADVVEFLRLFGAGCP